MKMKNPLRTVCKTMVALALVLGLALPTLAEPIPDPPPPSDNAAVWYLTAQALLAGNTDEKLEAVIENWENPDLKTAKEAVAGIEQRMVLIRRASALKDCAWAVDIRRDGAAALLPHLGFIRQSAKLLKVSAEVKLESGDTEGAIDDLLVISRMSRHAAADGTLIGCLVQISIDTIAAETLAKHLHRFTREQLVSLRDQLNSLPPRLTVRRSLATERLMGVWLRDQLTGHAGKDNLKLLEELSAADLSAVFKNKDHDERIQLINLWLAEMDEFYQQLYDNFGLPHDEFVKADAKYIEDIENTDNLFVKLLMPALGGAYQTERRAVSIRAMLDAAIVLRLGGEDAFKAVVDPADGKPFDLAVTDAGLVLSSRLKRNDEHTSLTFSTELTHPLP